MSLGAVLAIVFVVLKLCHVIAWSWWWVISPVLIELGIDAVFLALVVTVGVFGFRSVHRHR